MNCFLLPSKGIRLGAMKAVIRLSLVRKFQQTNLLLFIVFTANKFLWLEARCRIMAITRGGYWSFGMANVVTSRLINKVILPLVQFE